MTKHALIIGLCLAVMPAYAQEAPPSQNKSLSELFGQKKTKFLPVHQAFGVNAKQDGDVLSVVFRVTPEHYVYQDKLALVLPDGVTASAWQFDKTPTMIDDPTFGQVAVFEEDMVASVVLTSDREITAPIGIKWQGCAKAGLCYPPETLNANIAMHAKKTPVLPSDLPSVSTPQAVVQTEPSYQDAPAPPNPQETPSATTDIPPSPLVQLSDVQTAPPEVMGGDGFGLSNDPEPLPSVFDMGQDDGTLDREELAHEPTAPSATINHTLTDKPTDPFGITKRPVVAVGLLFLLGLLLALTPCVYPMIPIVANIVARHNATDAKQGLLLSASYGVGVATAYGLLGMIIAWFGQTLGVMNHLQNPYVLGGFALVFVVLALGMFDVIRLKLPSTIAQTLQKKSQSADRHLGSMSGSFLVGLLSALVVSPCVSLPMAGALSAVATTGNALLGFVALFMLGLGLSVPLVIMGTMQGKFMPKSGVWMVSVKEFCGLLLLAVAVSLMERMWSSGVILVLWAVWFSLSAVWLYRLTVLPAKAMSFLAGVWAVCLMVGAGMGNTDAWRPLAVSAHSTLQNHRDLTVTTLSELDDILVKTDKVLVDVTATWCVECRIMERTLFANRPSELSAYQVVKFDITNTTDDSRALLARYGLFGPPALLIYHQGQLKNILLGETKRTDFIHALNGG
ncbi:MAG: protein-disulfide reductase DsbD [Moraxella sp.]|nr:protein-disulfide reductase DsbD [Moraxella sp.]